MFIWHSGHTCERRNRAWIPERQKCLLNCVKALILCIFHWTELTSFLEVKQNRKKKTSSLSPLLLVLPMSLAVCQLFIVSSFIAFPNLFMPPPLFWNLWSFGSMLNPGIALGRVRHSSLYGVSLSPHSPAATHIQNSLKLYTWGCLICVIVLPSLLSS